MNLAPILLFTYKRLDTLKQTVAALQRNYLAKDSTMFIFSDGARKEDDIAAVNAVRNYINTISGFKEIIIHSAEANKGLANSIIEGITKVIDQYGKVIVLEDDIVTSTNFLIFMNKALDFYEKNEKIFSIAGYTSVINNPTDDVYFTLRSSSWGWATWENRWLNVEWNIDNYDALKKDAKFRRAFNKMGSDMFKMLNDQMTGKINSWAIRWAYFQFKTNRYTVFPTVSKVQNIGMGEDATHTRGGMNRFKAIVDESEKTDFNFIAEPHLNKYYLNQFLKPYSIATRVKYKLLNTLKF